MNLLQWPDESSILLRGERSIVAYGSHGLASFNVDMLAVDPPWRQGNLSYWSHQAGIEQRWIDFVAGMRKHFTAPIVYLKVGLPESTEWIEALRSDGMTNILWWRTNYYAGKNAQIIAARFHLVGLDHAQAASDSPEATNRIAEWAARFGVSSVADPCVGKGVMLQKFMKAGMAVAGVELVRKRAEQAAKRLAS